MKILLIITFLIFSLFPTYGQFENLGKKIERKVKNRAERKVDRSIDKTLDKAEKGIDDIGKDKPEKKEGSVEGKNEKEDAAEGTEVSSSKNKDNSTEKSKPLTVYSKFDFVPGEKIVAVEDFAQDAIGDFPAKWNTNASGEIVTVEGYDSKWLAIPSNGVYTPEFITNLPENFTFEFNVLVNEDYSYYDSHLFFNFVELKNRNDFVAWKQYGSGRLNGVEVSIHPQDAGSMPAGRSEIKIWNSGKKVMENKLANISTFNTKNGRHAKISVWRQKQRLRVYINEKKIWDLPRAFMNEANYNAIVFMKGNSKDGNMYYVSDIRLAVGAPDTRHKLINEGKFSTTGILFNTNSDKIKPESFGTLKEIADVLKENGTIKVKIIGHTDGDGDDKYNLDLSKKRAESVKTALLKEFNIDGSRLETDGMGSKSPVAPNDTSEGKASNRRVEFTKL